MTSKIYTQSYNLSFHRYFLSVKKSCKKLKVEITKQPEYRFKKKAVMIARHGMWTSKETKGHVFIGKLSLLN